jgi:hypothetical protein
MGDVRRRVHHERREVQGLRARHRAGTEQSLITRPDL